MKIFLACALTHVPRNHFETYSEFLHKLANHLQTADGHSVKYALMNSDPQLATKPSDDRAKLCYVWDRDMASEADVLVAECSFPSIGLGIEMQVAAAAEIPTIIVFRDFRDNRAKAVQYSNPDGTQHDLQIGSGYVSLMALGLPTVFRVHQYADDKEGISSISKSLKLLDRQ